MHRFFFALQFLNCEGKKQELFLPETLNSLASAELAVASFSFKGVPNFGHRTQGLVSSSIEVLPPVVGSW